MWDEVAQAVSMGDNTTEASLRILAEWLSEGRIQETSEMVRIMLLAAENGESPL